MMKRTHIGYDDETFEKIYADLPTKRAICWSCDGHGVTTAHVESDGGGITGDEWAQWDSDERESYFSGAYDRPCPDCNGQKVVDAVDYERAIESHPAEMKQRDEMLDDEARHRAECEAERRAGC